MVFHSGTVNSDRMVQCSRVGLEVKIYDTPAGGIGASQGTFSSLNKGHSDALNSEEKIAFFAKNFLYL